MLEKIQEALAKYEVDSRDRVLLALSGGMDSVVLMQILLDLGYLPDIAHCNFQLRGADSDADETFCRQLAQQYALNISVEKFDTSTYAADKGLSIQMAARDLRYAFFESLDQKEDYRAILTAHHGDDQIETMLFKLARGSALEAVAGIREKRQKYVRPLLGILRKELEAYAEEQELCWREDVSNADTKYLRNAYRHRLIPLWEEIQPDLKAKILESSRLLREQDGALNALLEEQLEACLIVEDGVEKLNWSTICRKAYFSQLVYKWLARKGNWDWQAVNQLWKARKGRYTESEHFRLYQGQDCYELHPQQEVEELAIWIERDQENLEGPISLEMQFFGRDALELDGLPEHHFFDADKLKFPLLLRNWRDGDRFQPLGMSGSKKVSDYWIDQKMSMPEKARQLVLESDGEIIGLLGHRIDHRFRILNSTKTIYFVRLKK